MAMRLKKGSLFNHSSSFNCSIELLIHSSNSRNHAMEAENKKIKRMSHGPKMTAYYC